ncbi:hypothetical protein PALB_33040 [Pseudoalteromonas luteoviolacea B = ATCC 29581]|nr:hypothetical protein PALB_33040 [Pseudoalteromonas luteoviolacea B = ATCC 29581]
MHNEFEWWQVFLIIALVLGVIWSNIALLKYSNKFKFPSNKTDELMSKMTEQQNQKSESKKADK